MFPHSRSRVRKSGIEGNNERYSVCVAILFSWFRGFVTWDAADAINFFCEEGLIVAAFNEISNEFFTALIKECIRGAYATVLKTGMKSSPYEHIFAPNHVNTYR